jgi:hypothetical protein
VILFITRHFLSGTLYIAGALLAMAFMGRPTLDSVIPAFAFLALAVGSNLIFLKRFPS